MPLQVLALHIDMPPCRSSSSYRDMRATLRSAHEAGRAYDAVAWHPVRPRWDLNFHDVNSTAEVKMLAPTPRLVTIEERQRHRQLSTTEVDERAMASWRENFP
jgi:hypothetical protein